MIFGDRDLPDFHDVFRCVEADSGETRWEVPRLAIAGLDYGNSPRATPLIVGDNVICQGAHGHLLCIEIATGRVVWEKNFRDDFPINEELPWGYCGSPLLVDGKIIVAPGSSDASLLALDPHSGEIVWQSPGILPSYGSLNAATLGGVLQIVGHDAKTIGGWDVKTGERLWTILPASDGDFNVPTPIILDGKMFVVTENNGARLFEFGAGGQIKPDPIAVNSKLRSDMTTPVVVGNHLYCVKGFLYCLDIDDELSEQWRLRDKSLGDYASLISSSDHVLVMGKGELLLFDADGTKKVKSRLRVFDQRSDHYAHPAIVGDRLYLRGENRLVCLQL